MRIQAKYIPFFICEDRQIKFASVDLELQTNLAQNPERVINRNKKIIDSFILITCLKLVNYLIHLMIQKAA
jgi:hypothetical protein